MFDSSVIRKTHQTWKLIVWLGMTVLGGVSLWQGLHTLSRPAGESAPWILGGTAIILLGFAFSSVTIRCPRCSAHWLWMALSGQPEPRWLTWLMAQPVCPECAYPGPEPHASGDEPDEQASIEGRRTA